MKYVSGAGPLGMDSNYKFGIEIEVFNVNTSHNIRNISRNTFEKFKGIFKESTKSHHSLYHSIESSRFFKNTLSSDGKPYKKANRFEESLVAHGGAEIISPILHDNSHDWETINDVCSHIKNYPGTKGPDVIANSKCGLHIHFDANLLTQSPEIMKTFLTLWPHMEELTYKMCNDKNDPIRKSTLNRSKSAIKQFRKIAAPIGKKLTKKINENNLKLSYKNFGFLKRHLVAPLKLDNKRFNGLNLSNIGNPNKNTIEFRMSNGTIDPEIIKQNVFLYSSIINTARNIALQNGYKKEELQEFLKDNISEKQKAISFTNLIFDNNDDRKIYIDRWASVKDAKIFKNPDQKGFAPNVFTRQSFKNIAQRTPYSRINQAMDFVTSNFRSKGENLVRE